MAVETTRRTDMDPLVSYAFEVHFGTSVIARFSGVDGLSAEAEMIEYRDSADPNKVYYRKGRMKPARVTFKRGVAIDGAANFLEWLREIDSADQHQKQIYVIVGRHGIGAGSSETDKEVAWWLHDCKPTKWSLGSLEGNSNNALIESLEVVVSEITQKE